MEAALCQEGLGEAPLPTPPAAQRGQWQRQEEGEAAGPVSETWAQKAVGGPPHLLQRDQGNRPFASVPRVPPSFLQFSLQEAWCWRCHVGSALSWRLLLTSSPLPPSLPLCSEPTSVPPRRVFPCMTWSILSAPECHFLGEESSLPAPGPCWLSPLYHTVYTSSGN